MKVTPEVKPLGLHHRTADLAMWPLMLALGRFNLDSVQETHPWHIQNINPEQIKADLSIHVEGKAETIPGRFGPLFHMFGGWKNYVALQAEPPYHIGWVFHKKGVIKQSAVDRLLIEGKNVRMLTGPQDTETQFFALKPSGEQILLEKIGEGVLGDKNFPKTRLL